MTNSHTLVYRAARLVIVAVLAGWLLAACGGEQTPIRIYVTPTPQTADSTVTQTAATESPVPPSPSPQTVANQPTPIPSPAMTYGPVTGGGETPIPAAAQAASPTIPPNVTYGPVIGPGHTLVPTETVAAPTYAPVTPPTSGPTATPGPALRRDLIGIQIHAYISSHEFDQVMAYARDLGIKWIKCQVNWSLMESSSGQYTELFYMLRVYLQRAHDAGFGVLVSVAKAPGWSRTVDADGVMREDGPPNDPQALANFLSGMLNAVGVDVNGTPYISAVEVWNEPNLQREWHGHALTGADYMTYFVPAYKAIRQFSPSITIITAAPAPTGDSDVSTNDRTWLQQIYNAGLAQYGQDVAVGIHPYAWANAPDARCCASPSRGWDDQPQFFFLDTIEAYHQIMQANGHGGALLWATEFGWATFDGMHNSSGQKPADPADTPYFGFITQWQQADYTLRAFEIAETIPYLGPMILWNLNFSTLSGVMDKSDPQAAYAILDSNWQPRPVYQALKQAAKSD